MAIPVIPVPTYSGRKNGFEREKQAPRHILAIHNMRYGIIHGTFYQMATAFADPYAVIPLFLAGFTESAMLIGLIVSLISAVTVVPQLSIAHLLQKHFDAAKPLMLIGIWLRCGVWGLIAILALFIPDPGAGILLLFALLVSLYSLGGGIAVLPFKQIISQTIPLEKRSSFFGWRLIGGGILSVLAGGIIKVILDRETLPWPQNYGFLFLFSFLSLLIAYIAMSRFQFVPIEATQSSHPLRVQIWHIFRDYPVLKRLILVRLLSGGLTLVFPFLILYATRELGITLGWVGLFVIAQRGGAILSNLVWMPLGNRHGTRLVIMLGLILSTLGLAVMFSWHTPLAIAGAFALSGSGMSAMLVGFSGYILELGVPEIRPLLFAMEGTLLMPLYFMPMLGGWLTDRCGYQSVLLTGGIMLLGALALSFSLCEPRRNDVACGPCIAA